MITLFRSSRRDKTGLGPAPTAGRRSSPGRAARHTPYWPDDRICDNPADTGHGWGFGGVVGRSPNHASRGNPRRSNKLMQARVIMQGLALLLLAILMLLSRH